MHRLPTAALLTCITCRPQPHHCSPSFDRLSTPAPPRRREKLAKGEEVDDDLADLGDPDLLAEAAASHKLAEAAAAAEAEEAGIDDDPYGAGAVHESGAVG